MVRVNLTPSKIRKGVISDKVFKIGATLAGVYVLVMIVFLAFQLVSESYPIWEENGLSFITKTEWNAVEGREDFGAL
ncbi:MAG: phosphate ABC transporter permease subunit PstC, partial [Nitrosopumilales archaeon CG15_BIG_FIL_POST_REV_8_21_14_020_37_12]